MCTHIKYKLYTKLYLYLFYKYGVYTNTHGQSKYTHKNNDISTYISNTAATIGVFNMICCFKQSDGKFFKAAKNLDSLSAGKNSVHVVLQILLIILLVRNIFF